MEIVFEYPLGEVVYNKPTDHTGASILSQPLAAYVIISRIYEEISSESNGIKSYVVRHNDPTTPGGGKMYKFAECELVSKDAFDSLMAIKRKDWEKGKKENTSIGGVGYSPQQWQQLFPSPSIGAAGSNLGSTYSVTTNNTSNP